MKRSGGARSSARRGQQWGPAGGEATMEMESVATPPLSGVCVCVWRATEGRLGALMCVRVCARGGAANRGGGGPWRRQSNGGAGAPMMAARQHASVRAAVVQDAVPQQAHSMRRCTSHLGDVNDNGVAWWPRWCALQRPRRRRRWSDEPGGPASPPPAAGGREHGHLAAAAATMAKWGRRPGAAAALWRRRRVGERPPWPNRPWARATARAPANWCWRQFAHGAGIDF